MDCITHMCFLTYKLYYLHFTKWFIYVNLSSFICVILSKNNNYVHGTYYQPSYLFGFVDTLTEDNVGTSLVAT